MNSNRLGKTKVHPPKGRWLIIVIILAAGLLTLAWTAFLVWTVGHFSGVW